MKIKFKVHHSYGLHREEVFSLEELGLEQFSLDEISRDNEQLYNHIRPLLVDWTNKHYFHDDALPSWEVVEGDE